jgi:hypothetical protein
MASGQIRLLCKDCAERHKRECRHRPHWWPDEPLTDGQLCQDDKCPNKSTAATVGAAIAVARCLPPLPGN